MGSIEPRLHPQSLPLSPRQTQLALAMGGVESGEEESRWEMGIKEPGQIGPRTASPSSGRHGKRLPTGLSSCVLFLGKVLHSIIHVNST